MNDFSRLESTYKPSQADIETLTLEKFIDEHYAKLNGITRTNMFNSLGRIGITSLRALYEADLNEIKNGYRIGEKKLYAIQNLKDEIIKELSEEEP